MRRELPQYLRTGILHGKTLLRTEKILEEYRLNTICSSAKCPNRGKCYSRATVTFLIMGDICTRNCRFCAVTKGVPKPLESWEPKRIAEAVKELGLKYDVITSVTRDDLEDGGASHFAKTIREIRWAASEGGEPRQGRENPRAKIEVLIPDFQGSVESLKIVLDARPDVLSHNLETVPRLYKIVRPKADYKRSLQILLMSKVINPKIPTKSGLMLGLGESRKEIIEVMEDLRKVECDLLTLGHYLAPSENHLPIARFVLPEEFKILKKEALKLSFKGVVSEPLARSSYKASELFKTI